MQCKGKLETDILYVVVSKMGYSCVSKLARMEVKVKLDNSRKKLRKTCLCVYVQFVRENC
jgi:hypothetical protein